MFELVHFQPGMEFDVVFATFILKTKYSNSNIHMYKPFAVYFNVEIVIEPLFVVLTALK